MSIEQTDLIDIISVDQLTGETILTVSDHLDWSDSPTHLRLLQNKLNRYLAFVKSGEIFQSQAQDRRIIFTVQPADSTVTELLCPLGGKLN